MPRRTPSCDGNECEPLPTGWWHSPDCLTWRPDGNTSSENMASDVAREEGHSQAYGVTAGQARPKAVAA